MILFVAASSKDRLWARTVIDGLARQGHEVHDWTRHPGYDDPEQIDPEQIARENLAAVSMADGLIWLLSESASTGAPLEVGFAHGWSIPVLVLPLCEIPRENVYPHMFTWVPSVEAALGHVAAREERE